MDWRRKLYEKFIVKEVIDEMVNIIENDENNLPQIEYNNQIGEGLPNINFTWKEISKSAKVTSARFKRTTEKTTFLVEHNFGAFSDLFLIENNIDELFNEFMQKQLENASENDVISLNISHDNLNGKPIFVSPQYKRNFNKHSFFNAIYEISQSNETFLFNGKLSIDVNIMKQIQGSGKRKMKIPITAEESLQRKSSVITINNNDNGCFFHALAVCKGRYEISDKYLWQCMRRDTRKIRTIEAMKLANNCGYNLNTSITCEDFPKIAVSLGEFQLIVIDSNNKTNRIFVGKVNKQQKLFVLFNEDDCHFDAITNINGFMGAHHYCAHCHKTYDHIYGHKCEFICDKCFQFPICNDTTKIMCQLCNFEFNGEICYNNHLSGKNTVCRNIKKCLSCSMKYSLKHECDVKRCKNCGDNYKLEKHFCYLKTLNLEKLTKQDENNKIIISYDIECQQNISSDGSIVHTPDLLISMTVCDLCWDANSSQKLLINCEICGNFKNNFKEKLCIKLFGDYLYALAKKVASQNLNLFVFAHNAKGYDNHFILNDLFLRGFTDTSVIMNGTKVLKASAGNVYFLDSLLMFQQPLASLPKAFGLDHLVKKGYFPHNFHNNVNYNYEGDLPDKEYFGTNYMKPAQLKDFELWYENMKMKLTTTNAKYNLIFEMDKYCENDVLILLNCIQEFRKTFKSVTSIDPITRCFTLASMGLEIFKAKIMPENKIGVTPIKGYRTGHYSRIGNCWIDYMQKLLDCEIDREVPIDNYIVDGYNKDTNTVFEYNGCYHHCHHCVYKNKRSEIIEHKSGKNMTPDEIYEETLSKK